MGDVDFGMPPLSLFSLPFFLLIFFELDFFDGYRHDMVMKGIRCGVVR